MSAEVTTYQAYGALGVECIHSFKTGLAKNGLLDSVLKSNLDYAMKAVEAMPISKRTNAALQVEGEQSRIRITTGKPVFYHLVWNDNDGPKLLQQIKVGGTQLTTKHIEESHFMGHCCRDEVMSCMKQAREAVTSNGDGLANVELKIRCGELQLTYTTWEPSTTIEIQPEWRVRIQKYYMEDVLRVKHHMEKVGEMSPGMLACFRLLLTDPPTKPAMKYDVSHILLMSEGQKVVLVREICVNSDPVYPVEPVSYVILFDGDEAKMFYSIDYKL